MSRVGSCHVPSVNHANCRNAVVLTREPSGTRDIRQAHICFISSLERFCNEQYTYRGVSFRVETVQLDGLHSRIQLGVRSRVSIEEWRISSGEGYRVARRQFQPTSDFVRNMLGDKVKEILESKVRDATKANQEIIV